MILEELKPGDRFRFFERYSAAIWMVTSNSRPEQRLCCSIVHGDTEWFNNNTTIWKLDKFVDSAALVEVNKSSKEDLEAEEKRVTIAVLDMLRNVLVKSI